MRMTRIDTAHNLYVEANHLALRLSPGAWLVDTGSDASFGVAPVLHITAEPRPVLEKIGNLTPAKLRAVTGGNYIGLIGNDILGELEVLLDLKRSASGIACFHAAKISDLPGRRVGLEFIAGSKTPVVQATVGDEAVRVIFDTGAQYSYLESLEGIEAKPVGPSTDFVITAKGPVNFDVNLHEVTVTVGSITAPITFATEPGKLTCPPAVGALLKATGTQGILGWEILKHGRMAYLPRRGELWI